MQSKTINTKEKTWERLISLKFKLKLKSVDELLNKLLDNFEGDKK